MLLRFEAGHASEGVSPDAMREGQFRFAEREMRAFRPSDVLRAATPVLRETFRCTHGIHFGHEGDDRAFPCGCGKGPR